MASTELLTQADYAKHRGVTRQYVGKLVAEQKIPIHLGENGEKLIDPAEADLALGDNVERILAEADADTGGGDTVAEVLEDEADDVAEDAPAVKPTPGLTAAKTRTEEYRSRLLHLDIEQKLGKLRPVDDIRLGAQLCAEGVIRAVSRIRGRGDELFARVQKDGVFGARAFLRDLERDILKASAAEFAKLAAGELPSDDSEGDAGEDGE